MKGLNFYALRATAQIWWEVTMAGFWVNLLNRLGRKAQSQLTQKVKVVQDIFYAENDGVKLQLDLFVPKEPPPPEGYPVVIALHGGAWCTGSRKDMGWAGLLLARRGMVVASIGYRLAPQFRYPAQLKDCQAALVWLKENASNWGANPNQIAAFGISSGGHLALLLGLKSCQQADERSAVGQWGDKDLADNQKIERQASEKIGLKKIVALFPPTDLTANYYRESAERPLPFIPNYLLYFLGATYDENPEVWHDASPIFHVNSNAPPCFIIHGKKDLLVPTDQAIRFADAMRKVGAKVTLVLIDGLGHGYSIRPQIMHQLHNALDEAVKFLMMP
ncbi:MAG: alpha/beta hydrolase [Armatimonadetes bacterium]|nr:alpha/beta hydrolase [Armatimonadota bacterium]MDW8028601.1 alpha/beta hydrolase [Armatimonadota bacterium]